jgi:4-hydroxy-tetrahydrodipicolinate synthase
MPVRRSPEEIRHALAGPVPSLRTPFTREGEIDYPALGRMIEFDLAAGATALIITWGDSLFALLREREVAELTQRVVEITAGRAVVAACTGRWITAQAVEFAACCRAQGADVLQVFVPTWYPGAATTEALVAHHAALAAVMPVMANSAEFQRHGAGQGLPIAKALLATVPNVIAMKADVTGEFDRKLCLLAREQWAIFSGGTKQFHLELHPYGCQGHMTTWLTFRPAIAWRYWRAIQAGDLAAAAAVIKTYDHPLFDLIGGLPGGFDAGMHGLAALAGLAQPWRRAPFHSITEPELERLRHFLDSLPE